MRAIYQFDSTPLTRDPGLQSINNQKNMVLSFTLGDMKFTVEPGAQATAVELPSKVLRCASAPGSGLVPATGGLAPNQDYQFLTDSTEYTYTTRQLIGSGPTAKVIEKQMSSGAKAGQEGRMILYKGCQTLGDAIVGNWTERLIRPFLITVADLATRDSGWAEVGTAPTVNVASKTILDNGGDGYNHI